jgi:predicted transcriptional regulator
MRITDLSENTGLNHPEIRRHLSRLDSIDMIVRDVDGYYSLTPHGETLLLVFQELDYLSSHSEYFRDHKALDIPTKFIKTIGELSNSNNVETAIDFFHKVNNLIKNSEEKIDLLVEQFPINVLSTILEVIDKGVRLRVIEPRERLLNSDLESLTSEKTKALDLNRITPSVEQRMLTNIDLLMFLSETQAIIAFPLANGQYDYTGFTTTHETAIKWCEELFQHYWDEAEYRSKPTEIKIDRTRDSTRQEPSERIIVIGQNNPKVDAQAVQNAVDNFDEVILKGTFNLGSSKVEVSKSVVVKGEGRKNGIPVTKIFKKGWIFPFREWDAIFFINGEGADVTIENIHFTDFNCAAIQAIGYTKQNSVKILNNRMTIQDGYGRGIFFASFGDFVHGVLVEGVGPDGVLIEGNYIDLGAGGFSRGILSRGGLEDKPEYRPDLFNHEYFIGFGIAVNACSGSVVIKNNVVRNANGRGIATSGHLESTRVKIRNNEVFSEIFGSYPFSSRESGAGVLAQSALGFANPGFYIEIENNTILLEKLNYSGIIVLGPATDETGAGKLKGGLIRGNQIHLKEGYEGIHVRKCDDFKVSENTLTGKTYYGIRISGRKKSGELDLRAINNHIENNNMKDLLIKCPDEYSKNHQDGRMFSNSETLTTSNVWMDRFSKINKVKIKKDETVINEGEKNEIIFE